MRTLDFINWSANYYPSMIVTAPTNGLNISNCQLFCINKKYVHINTKIQHIKAAVVSGCQIRNILLGPVVINPTFWMICVHLCQDLKRRVCAYKKRAPFHSDLPDFPHMLSGYLSYKSEMKEHYFNIQAYTKWCHQSRRLQDQARPTVLITSHIDVINLNNTLHKILLGYFIQSPQAYWSGHLGHPQSVRSRTFTC